MMKSLALIIFLSIKSQFCIAPVKEPWTKEKTEKNTERPVSYPKGYFRNPLGIPIQLAANFGELRTNHFHMGLDIRTNQRENLPVYAAAEGYISKIKIERYGFGRAIYIAHPNGYTTLYAHLNDFYPPLNNYIISKQYEDERWEQEIDFAPNQFPVSKGQFIAYSGNTGGSAGPHLHFEIRDSKTGNNLNPWLFNFNLPDNIRPSINRLFYYDRRYSTYQVNPIPVAIRGANGNYSTVNSVITVNSPYISFGIAAEDKTTPSSFRLGIYGAAISVDGETKSDFTINDISYDDTRYLNASIDYKTKFSGGGYIQHLSRLPGNQSTIFSKEGDGTITINDTSIHTAEIIVKDAQGNTSKLAFKFRYDPTKSEERMFALNAIPLSPNKINEFKTDDLEVTFSPAAFYDTVPFVHRSETSTDPKVVSAVHFLHNTKVPVHENFLIRIKPNVTLTEDQKSKTVIQFVKDRKPDAVKGTWTGEFLEGRFRDFGEFKLVLDTIAPRVSLSGWANGAYVGGRKAIAINASDNVGEIKSFKAFASGQWLLFSRKNNQFIHRFDEHTPYGKQELRIVVEDLAGNVTEKVFNFTR